MASDTKISNLPAAVALNTTDKFAIVQSGTTKSATIQQILDNAEVTLTTDAEEILAISGQQLDAATHDAGDSNKFLGSPAAGGGKISLRAIVSADLPSATTGQQGAVELATQAETQALADTDRAITPDGLGSVNAGETQKGLAELATQGEVNAGADDSRIVTPLKLHTCTATTERKGVLETATDAETQALAATDKIVTPASLNSLNASNTQKGILETATNAETQALSLTNKIVTPGNLGALSAGDAQRGIAELATDAEVQTGTDDERIVTPAGLRSDSPSTPAANRILRLDSGGDANLPSGGDILVNGNTDETTGLGNLLKMFLGQLSLYADFVGDDLFPMGYGWYSKADGEWVNWADGETGAVAYKGSDDFLVDNYAGGTNQWSDVTVDSDTAAPYAVSVSDHLMQIQAKKSGDGTASHAAIETDITSSTNCFVYAMLNRPQFNYLRAGGGSLDYVTAVMVSNAGYTELFAAFVIVDVTVMDGGNDYTCTVDFKRYYHATDEWEPYDTDADSWTTNWTSLVTLTGIPIGPLLIYFRPYATSNYLYFGVGVGGNKQVSGVDRVTAAAVTGPFTKGILFQSYFDATTSRHSSYWDFVRFKNV